MRAPTSKQVTNRVLCIRSSTRMEPRLSEIYSLRIKESRTRVSDPLLDSRSRTGISDFRWRTKPRGHVQIPSAQDHSDVGGLGKGIAKQCGQDYGSGRLDHQFHSGHDDPLRRDSLRIGHLQNIGEIFLHNGEIGLSNTGSKSVTEGVGNMGSDPCSGSPAPFPIGRPLGLDPIYGKALIHSKAEPKTTSAESVACPVAGLARGIRERLFPHLR